MNGYALAAAVINGLLEAGIQLHEIKASAADGVVTEADVAAAYDEAKAAIAEGRAAVDAAREREDKEQHY